MFVQFDHWQGGSGGKLGSEGGLARATAAKNDDSFYASIPVEEGDVPAISQHSRRIPAVDLVPGFCPADGTRWRRAPHMLSAWTAA